MTSSGSTELQAAPDVIVLGAGPAGLMAAARLAQTPLNVALVGPVVPSDPAREARTAALFPAALGELQAIGVWEKLAPVCAPISAIRIVDDMGRLFRAPEVRFEAREAGLDVLAQNVPNGPLVAALEAAAGLDGRIRRFPVPATEVTCGDEAVRVTLATGETLSAPLVVAADGRNSKARTAAGIETRSWRYGQTAIAAAFQHSRSHRGVSSEFHRPAGPFTVVPLPGHASSLVWLETPATVERLVALDDRAFAREIMTRLGGLLGAVTAVAPRVTHPMGGLIAEQRAAKRVVLIGETAHAFPPIGAQGLNLTLRDVAALVEVVAEARARGRDLGGSETLASYEDARGRDVTARVYGVDLLNRSLIAGPLAGLARGVGLHALHAVPALKRLAMRQGFGAASARPAHHDADHRAEHAAGVPFER